MKITCGLCDRLLAESPDADEAAEIAEYDEGHHYHSESGEWECDTCWHVRYAEGMAEAMEYEREYQLEMIVQETRDAQDAILDAADLANDTRKENR